MGKSEIKSDNKEEEQNFFTFQQIGWIIDWAFRIIKVDLLVFLAILHKKKILSVNRWIIPYIIII